MSAFKSVQSILALLVVTGGIGATRMGDVESKRITSCMFFEQDMELNDGGNYTFGNGEFGDYFIDQSSHTDMSNGSVEWYNYTMEVEPDIVDTVDEDLHDGLSFTPDDDGWWTKADDVNHNQYGVGMFVDQVWADRNFIPAGWYQDWYVLPFNTDWQPSNTDKLSISQTAIDRTTDVSPPWTW